MKLARVALVAATLLGPGLAAAEDGEAPLREAPAKDVALFREARGPALTLAPLLRIGAVVCLVGAAGWGLSVYAGRRRVSRGGSAIRLELLAVKSLGPRHRVAVIEIEDRRLLIGLGGDSIQTLADLSGGESFERTLDERLPHAQDEEPSPSLLNAIGRFDGLDA